MNIRTSPYRTTRLHALSFHPSTLALLLFCTSLPGCRKQPKDETGEQAGGNADKQSGEQEQSTTGVSHLLSATLEVESGVSRLVLRFDTPATELETVGAVLDKAPVVSSPETSWSGHFSDRQTLVVTPASPLSPATRYEIRFDESLSTMHGGIVYSWIHEPLEIVHATVESSFPMASTLIGLRTSAATTRAAVESACALVSATHERISLRATAHTPAEEGSATAGRDFDLNPVSALPESDSWTLHCQGLMPVSGTAAAAEYRMILRENIKFQLFNDSDARNEIDPDDFALSLRFNAPVKGADLAQAVKIDPPLPELVEQFRDVEQSTYFRADLGVDGQQTYRVTFDPELKDIYGRKLGETAPWVLRTRKLAARVSIPTGVHSLERAFPGIEFAARGLDEVDISCAALPRESVAQMLLDKISWSPSQLAERGEVWKTLGVTPKSQKVRSTGVAKLRWRSGPLNLSKHCSQSTDDHSFYLAQVSSEQIDNQWWYPQVQSVILNHTDLAIHLRKGARSGLVWVTSLKTGKPVANADVRVVVGALGEVFQGKTGEDGLVRLPGVGTWRTRVEQKIAASGGELRSWQRQAGGYVVFAQSQDDLAVLSDDWSSGVESWNFSVPYEYQEKPQHLRLQIQSDRGIYRPGETAHLRGWARDGRLFGRMSLPKETRVAAIIEDAKGRKVVEEELNLSDFGGFWHSVAIPEDAPLGDWSVRYRIGDQSFYERFAVQEFRPATFESEAMLREKAGALTLIGSSSYFSGGQVGGASIKWNLNARAFDPRFDGYEEYRFDGGDGNDGAGQTGYLGDGEAKLSTKGTLRIAVGKADAKASREYLATITTTDIAGQTVVSRASHVVHAVDGYVGLKLKSWFVDSNEKAQVDIVALNVKGKRVAASGELVVSQSSWTCDDELEYEEEGGSPCRQSADKEIGRIPVEVASKGLVRTEIPFAVQGDFVIRFVPNAGASKLQGSAVEGWASNYESDDEWLTARNTAFEITPDQKNYQPGQVAKLALATPLRGQSALLTIERGDVVEAKVLSGEELIRNGWHVGLPAIYAPNVYATAVVVGGRTGEGKANSPKLRMGMVNLPVSISRHLEVKIETTKPRYAPGERVIGDVIVLSNGQPVNAEVALSVADEGVLSLIGFRLPDPLKAFFSQWPRALRDASSYLVLLREQLLIDTSGEEGADKGGDKSVGRVRRNFLNSAFWAPAILTDAQGKAHFEFIAPDNLTTYRMMATAASRDDRFGTKEQRLPIFQELQAQPIAPRFLIEGDRAKVGALLRNLGQEDQQIEATLTVSQLSVAGAAKSDVLLGHGKDEALVFEVVANGEARAQVKMSAKAGTLGDAFEVDFPIHRAVVHETRMLASGPIHGETSVDLNLSADTVRNESRLVVRADLAGLSELGPGLEYLVQYPHGCLEQTISKILPMASLGTLVRALEIEGLEIDKIPELVNAGIAKIVRHQHDGGHFSLWPDAETRPHLTAMALLTLHELRDAKYVISDDVVANGLNALSRSLPSAAIPSGWEGAQAAMEGYALAVWGREDSGLTHRLFGARAGLATWGKTYLLRTMVAAKSKYKAEIKTLATEIKKELVAETALRMVAPASRDGFGMDSDARTTALVLQAALDCDCMSDVEEKLIAGLMSQRRDGRWTTTQGNIHALSALARVAKKVSGKQSKMDIYLDDEHLLSTTIKQQGVARLDLPLKGHRAGKLRLVASDTAHVSAYLDLARRIPDDARLSRFFEVKRVYLDAHTQKPIDRVEAGDLVLVRLTVVAENPAQYVAITDFLPAGLEPELGQRLDRRWQWTHAEVRDDRALFYLDDLSAGAHVYEYLARASTQGVFTALPPTVETMYDPEPYARGRSASVQVIGRTN